MAPNFKTRLPLLFLALLSLSTLCTISQAREDPQLRECTRSCSQKPEHQRKQCVQQCWEKHQERGRERESDLVDNPHGDAEKRFSQCRQQCEQSQYGGSQLRHCEQLCEKQYKQEREKERQEREMGNPRREEWGEEKSESEERGGNPYVFQKEQFKHTLRTEHGTVMLLKNFYMKSKLLLGIANYRLAVIELNPLTFLLPHHWDADDTCYVAKGKGMVTVLKQEGKQSHKIKQGDILKVDAGSIVYVINSDSQEKLILVTFINPVSTPGRFEAFFGAGGENPESFYRAFTYEVLEAAFNTQGERIEKIFRQQSRGPIVQASEEQIRAMTDQSSEGRHLWPFGEGGSEGTFNLFNKRPTFSNQYGELYEADSNDWKRLGDLDVKVSFANISSGSMIAPSYNSRSTSLAVVLEGRGRVEIICPRIEKESESHSRSTRERYEEEDDEEQDRQCQQAQQYQKIQSNIYVGTVFVIPAGHPAVAIASGDENLQIMCFETRAENNERIFLAGRNNIMRKMEREAKELAFDTSAREVDELFNSQHEEAFMPGPKSRHSQRGHGSELFESVLEMAVGM